MSCSAGGNGASPETLASSADALYALTADPFVTPPPSFFGELKRRRVVRAAMVYVAAAFAVLQAADVVFPILQLPDRALSVLLALAALGLPVALGLAWVFDLTPEGVVRSPDGDEEEVVAAAAPAAWVPVRTAVLVVVMLAVGVGAGWLARSAASGGTSGVGDRTVAVVPLENLSTDPDNAFFAIGVQDEILTQLEKISDLHVISRSSTMRFPPGPERAPMRTLGRELGARWIVEGSVARIDQEVRINLQLIESASDAHVWAEVYDGDLTVQGLLAFQAQVARRVAASLKATIQPEEASRIASIPTDDVEAYDLYLRGIDAFSRRREADLRRALDLFGSAIAIDSSYALAYAGRALTYAVLPFYAEVSPRDSGPLGVAAAERALALDSTVAEAYAALGDLRFHVDYDFEGAEAALRQAIRLKPSLAQAWDWLSEALGARGQIEEALDAERRALDLDPLAPRFNLGYGELLRKSGRTAEAVTQLERATRLDATYPAAQVALATAYLDAGRFRDAADGYHRYAELVGPEVGVLERVALAAGDPARRGEVVAMLDLITQPSWRLRTTAIAAAYVRVGQHEKALAWLERAYAEGDVRLPFVFHDVTFAPLRDEPAFRELAAKVGVTLSDPLL